MFADSDLRLTGGTNLFLLPFVIPVPIVFSFLPSYDIEPSSSDVIMYAYIAWDLFTNLETFSTLIDFQKKCYGKYTPKAVFSSWFIYTKYHTNFQKSQLF